MNKRGSALINVLVVATVLMILGLLVMRVVMSDMKFSRADRNRADALQLAESGIDYAIEQIVDAGTEGFAGGSYQLGDNVEISIEAIPETVPQEYRIISTADQDNSTRQVEVEVAYNLFAGPFEYSVFVGGEDTEDNHVEIKGIYDMGPVYIKMNTVNLEDIENFYGPVIIEADVANISKVKFNAPVVLDVRTVNFGSPWVDFFDDVVFVGCETTGTYTVHSPGVVIEDDDYLNNLVMPYVDINYFSDNADYTQWQKGVGAWSSTGEIGIPSLDALNYFPGTVTITGGPYPKERYDDTLVIVSAGDIIMDNGQLKPELGYKMILIAGGDIRGLTGEIKNLELPLYMYAGGDISAGNITDIRSAIALGHADMSPAMNTFYQFDTEVPGLTEAWSSRVTIKKWKN